MEYRGWQNDIQSKRKAECLCKKLESAYLATLFVRGRSFTLQSRRPCYDVIYPSLAHWLLWLFAVTSSENWYLNSSEKAQWKLKIIETAYQNIKENIVLFRSTAGRTSSSARTSAICATRRSRSSATCSRTSTSCTRSASAGTVLSARRNCRRCLPCANTSSYTPARRTSSARYARSGSCRAASSTGTAALTSASSPSSATFATSSFHKRWVHVFGITVKLLFTTSRFFLLLFLLHTEQGGSPAEVIYLEYLF